MNYRMWSSTWLLQHARGMSLSLRYVGCCQFHGHTDSIITFIHNNGIHLHYEISNLERICWRVVRSMRPSSRMPSRHLQQELRMHLSTGMGRSVLLTGYSFQVLLMFEYSMLTLWLFKKLFAKKDAIIFEVSVRFLESAGEPFQLYKIVLLFWNILKTWLKDNIL